MPNIYPISIEKEGVSDDFYTINELFSSNGDEVQKGDLVFCFETSKTIIDVEAPSDGYIYYNISENSDVQIGDIIALVSDEKDFSYQDWFSVNGTKKELQALENTVLKISKPAQRLIERHKIDTAVFNDLKLITKEDVEKYLSDSCHDIEQLNIPKITENSIVIFGGGGHAKMCIDVIKQNQTHQIIGIIDDNIKPQTQIFEIPVLGKLTILDKLIDKGLQSIILGIGGVLTKGARATIFSNFKEIKIKVPTIIHPSASLEPSVTYGEGNQVMQGAILGSNVKIGDNCIINSGSIISHDTVIGNNVHIAPGAIIGGGVTIKDNALVGMGCTVFLGLTIGKNVVIQNGVHIFKNIDNNKVIQKEFK